MKTYRMKTFFRFVFSQFFSLPKMRKFFLGPDLPGYMGGRFCKMAWRTAMMIFRNTAQSNNNVTSFKAIVASVI